MDYDTDKGGYVVNIDKDRLKDAPQLAKNSSPAWTREFGQEVYAYYGVMY